MHALAALGSIVGTFLTGFVLIQYLGSQMVVVSAATLLILLAIPFFRKARPVTTLSMLIMISLTAGITHQRSGFANPCDQESSYFCLRVIDSSHKAPFGQANGLILDHLLHGVNHLTEPRMLISPYVHLMDELVRERLTSDGLFTTNIVDAWHDPIMVKSMIKTLRTVFPHVHVWLEQVPDQPRRMTFVLSASSQSITGTRLDALKGFERSWLRVDGVIDRTGTDSATLPIFTDDYVPVERMIASLLLTEEGR